MVFRPGERFNIADYFLDQRIQEGLGEAVAIRTDEGSMTYEEVLLLASRFGQALSRKGVRREERVLIALRDSPEYVGALFGILKLGAVVVMVNPDLEADNLAALLDYSRATCAVVDASVLDSFERAARKASRRPALLVVGGTPAGSESFEEVATGLDGNLTTAPTHPDDPAIWLFSGGTTGRPKAVVQTHRSFANTTECYAKKALGFSRDDITLSVPKLFFGYATGSNLLFPFAVGGSTVLFPEKPTAEILFEKIQRHRPTVLINVPTMINQMVSHAQAAERDFSSLRFATSAGEALPAPLYERWKETFGTELLDGLGTAEMWHIFVSNVPGAVKPGTLGRVVPGFEIKVCDDEGREVPDGEIGRLWVKGESRAIGYWQNVAKTAESFRGEWFVGGDLVQRDEAGYVTYCGRGDDVLKVGGKWLAPQEVESCLMRHPAVAECAVIGVCNEDGLTKPCAFVISTGPGDDLEEVLKSFVLDNLQPYKHPRRVFIVDSLPRTHLGKVDRGALKKLARE
ncbi:MAG: benzoate-CoA ligase family protein [bacterium]|nr:benzoate-CoA ligase family protein [bacterium]